MCCHQLKGAEWHITAWGLYGAKPLSKPMLVIFHWTLESKFQWNFNQTITVSFKKMQIKMPFANWWSFCLAINMSTYQHFLDLHATWFMWPDNVWHSTWWRHQMETFSALLALCAGNSPVPMNSPHKGQWRGALMFSLIFVCINGWVNNRETGDLRRYRGHYDVIVMIGGLHTDSSGTTSASRRLKSPTNRLFVHQSVKSVMAVHLSTLLAFVLESRKSTSYQ